MSLIHLAGLRCRPNPRALFAALLSAVAAAGTPACHHSKPSETPSSSEVAAGDGGAGASPAADAAPPAAETPAPLGAILLTDPSAVQKLYDAASTAPAAALKDGGVKGPGAIAAGLRAIAKKAAPGMHPEGPMATGKLKEKDHLQMDISLEPGKCYALIGFSPKAKDLDLYLLTPPGVLSGQDTTDDNKPVVGRAPDLMCPASAHAITYKVDIFADAGAGDVGVQLYSKDQSEAKGAGEAKDKPEKTEKKK